METKNNTGAIFKNDKKTAETQPDYKGKVNVNGADMEVALWLKESKSGMKYFSATFQEPYVRPAISDAPAEPFKLEDDDLPF
jgi:uncharacterized protein (DUF736 family)